MTVTQSPAVELPARFLAKVNVTSTGCWEWTAGIQSAGYGAFWLNGSMRLTHRVSWEAVTRQVNTLRGVGPAQTSERLRARTHCKYDHPLSGDNLRVDRDGKRRCKECGRRRFREWDQRRKAKS